MSDGEGRVFVRGTPGVTGLPYLPQDTVVQHFAADGSPLSLRSAQNRVFKHLGYHRVHVFEPAPKYTGPDLTAAIDTSEGASVP